MIIYFVEQITRVYLKTKICTKVKLYYNIIDNNERNYYNNKYKKREKTMTNKRYIPQSKNGQTTKYQKITK